jgi:hypothetical protein
MKELDDNEEALLIEDFQRRNKPNCGRQIDDKKLRLAILEPLWPLHEGLIILDGFSPSRDFRPDMKCLELDERLSKLYRCATDAYKLGQLKLFSDFVGYSVAYKVKPKDLVEWIVGTGEELQFFSKAKILAGDLKDTQNQKQPKSQNVEMNSKEKSTLLKIIFGLVHKHYKYNPLQEKNQDTSKILKAIEQAGFKMDRKTLKKVIDEAYEFAKSEIEN